MKPDVMRLVTAQLTRYTCEMAYNKLILFAEAAAIAQERVSKAAPSAALLIESHPIRRLSRIHCYHNKVEVFIHSAIVVILFEMMMTLTIYSSPASHRISPCCYYYYNPRLIMTAAAEFWVSRAKRTNFHRTPTCGDRSGRDFHMLMSILSVSMCA